MEEKFYDMLHILPVYEHKKANGKEFTFIKCFIGYQILSHKEKDRARLHLSTADLKIKIMTGKNKGEIYRGRYMCSTDGLKDDYLLTFGGKNYFDKVYLCEAAGGEMFLFDYDLKYNHRMPSLDENGKVYATTSLCCYFDKYMSAEKLQKIQDDYNNAIAELYKQEQQKENDAVKPASIF
jgi:hypothetical protein